MAVLFSQNVFDFVWFTMRPGPGRPATKLMPLFVVGGIQKVAAPTGDVGSAWPEETIGSRKQGRRTTSVQFPASTPMDEGLHARSPLHE